MARITLAEYARRHGKSLRTMRQKAQSNGFQTAVKMQRLWLIDEDEPLIDNRVKNGKYIGWRKPKEE